MKETYVKPQLHVERFTLSQSIAVSCGYKDEWYLGEPKQGDKYVCACDTHDGMILWTNTLSGCVNVVGDDFVYEEFCYNAPEGILTIFAS